MTITLSRFKSFLDRQSLGSTIQFWSDYSTHVAVAVVCSMLAGAFLAFGLLLICMVIARANIEVVRGWLLHRPFLFQLIPASMLGYWIAPRMRSSRLAHWIWIPLTANLVVRIIIWNPGAIWVIRSSTLQHFFGQCPRLYCSDQFTVTLPFYLSIAYGVSAFIAQEGRCFPNVRRL